MYLVTVYITAFKAFLDLHLVVELYIQLVPCSGKFEMFPNKHVMKVIEILFLCTLLIF